MSHFTRRVTRLSAKVVARARRLAGQLVKPSEEELLLDRLSLQTEQLSEGVAGRVVVVTGSSRGVGLAVSGALARIGAKVVINGRSEEALQKAVKEMRAAGWTVHGVRADLGTEAGARLLIEEALRAYGKVDVLINNAAVPGPTGRYCWEITSGQWEDVLRSNLTAPFLCSKFLINHFLSQGVKGRILNVSSGAGQTPYAKFTPYGVSKSGMEALTKYLSVEVGTSGITVTAIMLGSVMTDMTKSAFPWEVFQDLPSAETVVPSFLHAITAPAESVHGKILAAWRFGEAPSKECILNGPLAVVPRLTFPPLLLNGVKVERDSPTVTVFDRAENPYGTSAVVRHRLTRAVKEAPLCRYPDHNYSSLRSTVAREFSLPEESLTFGNGSSELIERLLRIFVKPGEEVVSEDPGWFIFDRFCTMMGISNRKVATTPSANLKQGVFSNLEPILKAIGTRTRVIYLISPNNPVGISIKKEHFKEFLNQVPKHIPVVVDEAYLDFAQAPQTLRTHSLVAETDRLLIGIRTFSKFFGLAGMRVGYAFSSPPAFDLLNRLELPFNVSQLSEIAAVAALEDTEHRNTVYQECLREKQRIYRFFDDNSLDYVRSEANTILVECPCDAMKFYTTFEAQGVYLSRGLYLDRKYAVFPVGTPKQNDRNFQILKTCM